RDGGRLLPVGCGPFTVTLALALLSFPFGSLLEARTMTSPVAVAGPTAAVAAMTIGAAFPTGSEAIVQFTGALPLHVHPAPDAALNDAPERLVTTVTFSAGFGPKFARLTVKVSAPPLLAGFGEPERVTFR